MCFPERFIGDPIVIDEHCAISFTARPMHCCVVTACNTSSRRIKVRIDFTQCTRYCVFSPAVGAVGVGSMAAEVTIAPHRLRNVAVVEQKNGASLLSHAALLLQLQHVVQVFVENDKGVMLPAGKWNRACKEVSPCSAPPTLLPTTRAGLWPTWLSHLRPHDFIAKRVNAASAHENNDEERAVVALQVDEVAGGAAFLLGAVNRGKTPHCVMYHLQPEWCATEADTSSPFLLVLMDGWVCNEVQALKGYVPGCGDVALGWVVRRDAAMPTVERPLSHSFTAVVCEPTAQHMVAQDAVKAVTAAQRRPGCATQGVQCGANTRTRRRKAERFSQKPNILHATDLEPSTGSEVPVVLEPPPPPLPLAPHCSTGSSSSSSAAAAVVAIGNSRNTSPSPALFGKSLMSPKAETGMEARAQSPDANAQNHLVSDCGEGLSPDLETRYMRDLGEGLRSIRSNVEAQIEAEVERRIMALEIMRCGHQSSVSDVKKRIPHSGACRKEETTGTLDNSITTAHTKQSLRRLEAQEALERISTETAEMTEWRLRLLEWKRPTCLICEKPVSAWALFMEDPVNGQRVHFSCYIEMRQYKLENREILTT